MQDSGTISFLYGHHHCTIPLAFDPLGYGLDVTRGPTTDHCGHSQPDSKIEVTLKEGKMTIRAHVQEEYIRVKWEVHGNFQPDSLPF
jgi:hypothetical protein